MTWNYLCKFIFACLFLLAAVGTSLAQPAVAPTTDPANGFPLWYQDANGVRVEQCLNSADPFCVLLPDPGFNPANPVVFPTNFPVEFFYFVADSDKLTTPGCPASGIAAGTAKWRGALEGSFLNGTVIPGDQMTFTRTKIVVSGLCPNTTYTFTTPYGVDQYTTNASGQIVANKKGATIDIGCLAAPCDFSIPLTSRVMGAFLTFDPASGNVPPPGYLGDAGPVAGTLSPIIGSPTGTNVFSISLGGAVIASTNLFTVSGRIAGPLMAAPTSIDFSGVVQGTPSAPRTVVITNVYSSPITITGFSFTGANPTDWTVVNSTCNGPLVRDQFCTVDIVFTPSTLAVEHGQLQIAHDGPFRSPLNVDLKGTGIAGGAAPSVTLSASSLSFPNTRVRMQSPGQTINVSNIGNAPLLGTASLVNADPNVFPAAANQFLITNDGCSNISVAAGSSCSVTVIFDPSSSGPAHAILRFDNNAPTSPQDVALSGNATGGLAAVSTVANPPGLNAFGFPDWYQDENAVQLQPCLNPAEPCVLLADPGYNPGLALALPGNFPVEFFYFVADSDKMDVPGCNGLGGGKVTYRAALEGSFGLGVATPGQQIAFTRTKIVVSPGGLCPNTTYAFTHPYGTDLITTDGVGGVVANKKGATTDIGCIGAPCDFSLPLSSRVMGGFLKWDPAIAPAAPPGFLGDAAAVVGTPHQVVGSPYIDPVSGTPANFLRISDPVSGAVLNGCKDAFGVVGPCQTNLFTVSGKLAGPISASPSPITFAAQSLGTTSATQTVTLTNNDPLASVTINTASFVLANALDYSIASQNCTGAVLAPGGTCSIGIAFSPHAAGPSFAALSVSFSAGGSTAGLNTPVQVPLLGTGIAANRPPVAVDDSASTPANSGRILITVLANDSDPDGNLPLTVGAFTQALHGIVFLEATQDMSYTPNPGFSGTDTFTYQAQDSLGALSNVATVTVTVGGLSATTTSITAPAVTYPAIGLVTVSVSSATIPTGSVALSVDGGAAQSAVLDAAGKAIFSLAGLAAGNHSLSASYAAQGGFAASSASGTLTVNPAATSVGVSAPAITYNANGSVTITVSSAAGTPGGNVSLSVDGGAATSKALAGGSAVFTITSPAAGNHTLSASYAAQGNFGASAGSGTLTVNPAPTSMTISAPAISFGANGFVTVSVTSAAGIVTGNVSLVVDGALPVIQPLANGSTTFTVFTPSVGSHTLIASYAAQGNFSSSGATGTLTVNPAVANESITAIAQASRNKQLTQASWTVQGTTSIRTVHTMTITLTRTGALIGTANTDAKGQWKLSNGKSPIVPIPGDTITVTSSLGKVQTFPVQVK
jgi:hypothetical protein